MNPITDAIIGIAGTVLDRIFPDPQKQAEARLELLKLQQSGELAQMTADVQLSQMQADTNKAEAATGNVFIAGWRPFVGWVCGVGFAVQVLGPLMEWTALLFGKTAHFPALDFSIMAPTLFGMLGLGAMRTFEKVKGVEGNR